jgi:hypothetical protein
VNEAIENRRTAIWLILVALVLFSFVYLVPTSRAVYGSRSRGETALDLEVLRRGELLPIHKSGPLTPKDRLAIRYIPAGYLYLWVVGITQNRVVLPFVPGPADATFVYGWHAEAQGGYVYAPESVSRSSGPLIVYALLSPIPVKLRVLEEAVAESEEKDPEAIARSLQLPGESFVFRIERSPLEASR